MDVGVRNDVDLAGTLELSVSGEFSDPRPDVGVLHGTVTGSLTLTGDFDGDGVVTQPPQPPRAASSAARSTPKPRRITSSAAWPSPSTENCWERPYRASSRYKLTSTTPWQLPATITLSLERGSVSGMFAWKATQVTPGKFDATRLQGTPTPQISFTFYPEGMTGTASLALNTMADVQVVQWTYTFDVTWSFDDSATIPYWTFGLRVVVPVSASLTVDYDGDSQMMTL
jgi:hypothetical protein